jgi:hypothetical protein
MVPQKTSPNSQVNEGMTRFCRELKANIFRVKVLLTQRPVFHYMIH